MCKKECSSSTTFLATGPARKHILQGCGNIRVPPRQKSSGLHLLRGVYEFRAVKYWMRISETLKRTPLVNSISVKSKNKMKCYDIYLDSEETDLSNQFHTLSECEKNVARATAVAIDSFIFFKSCLSTTKASTGSCEAKGA